MPIMYFKKQILFIALLTLFFSHAVIANEENTAELSFQQKLVDLKQTLKEKNQQKKVLLRDLKIEKDPVILDQVKQELVVAEDIIQGVRDEIISLSTNGVELFSEPPVKQEKFDWKKDLQEILKPIFKQLRDITERPQLIEKLKADIEFWEKRETQLASAISNIKSNLGLVNQSGLKRELKKLLETAVSKENTAKQKLSLLRNELNDLQNSDSSIWVLISNVFNNVVAGLMLHFLLAILAAFIVYQIIVLLSLIPIYIISRSKAKDSVFAERTVVVIRTVLGALLGITTYFITLYSFTEWLLLILSLLIIAGVALSLKEVLPTYFVEIKTILNMGSIRQDERLLFQGLPWRITRLNMHTHLYNPALNGYLRVPLTEILTLSSRPYHKEEPWFPTSVGDTVLLEDNVYGQIVRQTPETVEVRRGLSLYTYQTTDFLARRPRNLTRNGFTIYDSFGYDYQHQADVTGTMLDVYKEGIKQALNDSPYGEHNTKLQIEFSFAAASSLDFRIIAAFSGEVAPDYYRIKRLFQTASVDLANKHGWVIPFQQVTLHHQPSE